MVTGYRLILASNSPRRRELLAGLDVDFEVFVLDGIDESCPHDVPPADVALYIARKKAEAYKRIIAPDALVITADTVVVVDDRILGKPHSEAEAMEMLREISGKTHLVITGVCLTTQDRQVSFSVETEVTFKPLSDAEIAHYVTKYKPYDKAGAYGIQEWIGYVGVTSLKGSYYNVMGLPVQRIYEELRTM
ncbi:MAG: Maf-like protein [Prevotella sp.]